MNNRTVRFNEEDNSDLEENVGPDGPNPVGLLELEQSAANTDRSLPPLTQSSRLHPTNAGTRSRSGRREEEKVPARGMPRPPIAHNLQSPPRTRAARNRAAGQTQSAAPARQASATAPELGRITAPLDNLPQTQWDATRMRGFRIDYRPMFHYNHRDSLNAQLALQAGYPQYRLWQAAQRENPGGTLVTVHDDQLAAVMGNME